MLYHVSSQSGLKVLTPHTSSHQNAYVYAVENLTMGLLFGAKKDDFDFLLTADETGLPEVYECYPGALQSVYQGTRCSVYVVAEDGFQRGRTPWDQELVCETAVPVQEEIVVDDLYRRLLAEEEQGKLRLFRYQFDDVYREKIAGHIVDRMIRFDVDFEARLRTDSRFSTHFKELVASLRTVLDGHLLP